MRSWQKTLTAATLGALTLSVLLTPRPVHAADYTQAQYQTLDREIGECLRAGKGSPSFDTTDRQIVGPRNLQKSIRQIVQDRMSGVLSHRSALDTPADQAFRQYMSAHVAEAVQGEIRVTVEARLAEARDYLREGKTDLFEDTLVALSLPPPPSGITTGPARNWLQQWQAQRAWIHGSADRALVVMEQLYRSLQLPAGG